MLCSSVDVVVPETGFGPVLLFCAVNRNLWPCVLVYCCCDVLSTLACVCAAFVVCMAVMADSSRLACK